MKTILFIGSVALASAVAEYYLPWWVIAIIPFLVALVMHQKPAISFFSGFAGIALFWLAAILIKDIPNDHILSTRMAALLNLPGYKALIVVVTLVGGLTGGLSAAAGSFLRYKKHAG